MAGDWPNNDSQITAIKAKTDNLPVTPSSQIDAQAGPTVPSADSSANTGERDVVGNKLDAAVTVVGTTKSLVAMLKGILNRTPTSGTISVITDVQAGATVPTTDGTATANSRDVVGAKDDAAVTTVGTTKSAIAYLKGILNRLPTSGTMATQADAQAGPTVPATDSTANTGERDVVGSKADTKAGIGTAANATLSLMAMLKGLWDLLRGITFTNLDAAISSRQATFTQNITTVQSAHLDADVSSRMATFSLPSNFNSLGIDANGLVSIKGGRNWENLEATLASGGTYSEITAAAAHSVIAIIVVVTQNVASGNNQEIALSIGAGGSEVIKIAIRHSMNAVGYACYGPIPVDPSVFSKGTRIAAKVDAAAVGTVAGITLIEIND